MWCGRRPSFFFLTMCITSSCRPPSPMPDNLQSGFATYTSRWASFCSMSVIDLYYNRKSNFLPALVCKMRGLSVSVAVWSHQGIVITCRCVLLSFYFAWLMKCYCLMSPVAMPCSLHRLPSHSTATLRLPCRGRWTPPGGWWECKDTNRLYLQGSIEL